MDNGVAEMDRARREQTRRILGVDELQIEEDADSSDDDADTTDDEMNRGMRRPAEMNKPAGMNQVTNSAGMRRCSEDPRPWARVLGSTR